MKNAQPGVKGAHRRPMKLGRKLRASASQGGSLALDWNVGQDADENGL